MFKKHKREALTLRRDLNFLEATSAGIGIIIGAGIYVLIGSASGYAKNYLWLSFLISAVVAFFTGLSYAELSRKYNQDSGEYSYVLHNFSKKTAFLVGYLVIISLIVGTSAVALGFSGYFNKLIGFDNIIITAVFILFIFSFLNYIGIKQSMKLNLVFTILSIAGLFLVIVFSFLKKDFSFINLLDLSNLGFSNLEEILKASSLIFFAYIGFESVVKLSEETKNPKKTIPLALITSLAVSSIIYILVAISAINAIGWEKLSLSKAPLAEVGNNLFGNNGFLILSFFALMSTGNTIIISLVALSRMLYSMSKDYKKIEFLAHINEKTKTPIYAVIISGVLTIAFVFFEKINIVAEITNFSVFVVFSIINLALIKDKLKEKKSIPFYAVLGFLTCLFMILNLEKEIIFIGCLICFGGFGLYNALRFK